jgi:predicted DNA binding CopG/RHH family protein
MKKVQKANAVRMTAEQVRARAKTRAGQAEIARAAAILESEIDTSDIPEISTRRAGMRGLFTRPETRQISIRLSATDLLKANQLAAKKGLPYQTYIKSLLHEALQREEATTT